MIMSPPVRGHLLVAPLRLEAPPGRRLSRAAWIAIAGSLALHVLGGVWIWNQHFRNPPPQVVDEGPPPILVNTQPLPPPKPPERAPTATRPKIVTPHTPTVATRPDVVAPFPPLPPQPTVNSDGPPVVVPELPPVAPEGPKVVVAKPPTPAGPKVIRDPAWVSRPSAEQMSRYYPVAASEAGLGGRTVIRCQVLVSGAVSRCAVRDEQPRGYGFGAAALRLSQFFRMSPKTEDGQPVDGASVDITLTFQLAD